MSKKVSFEEKLAKLEEMVSTLEDGTLPLDEAMKVMEEGSELAKDCFMVLEEFRQKANVLVEEINTLLQESEENEGAI